MFKCSVLILYISIEFWSTYKVVHLMYYHKRSLGGGCLGLLKIKEKEQ